MLFLVLALLVPVQPSASDADTLFALGNRLYAEGDFRGAAAAYEGAAETGWTSPALELALGAAYAEAGQLGRAVLHTERAHRLVPRDPDVRHNLRLLHARADAPESPASPADRVTHWLSAHIGADALALGLFAGYLVVLGLVGWRLWRRTPMPWVRRALVALVPLVVLLTVAAVGTARYETQPRAVVVVSEAAVRATPSATDAPSGVLPEGAVLEITEVREGWRAVVLPDGREGWVPASAVEEV